MFSLLSPSVHSSPPVLRLISDETTIVLTYHIYIICQVSVDGEV